MSSGHDRAMPAPGVLADGNARWTTILALALTALLAVRLGALTVNATDLFFDEAQYWSWSQTPDFGYYSKPPLIAWLITASTAICGDGEACVRVSSPILHTLTAIFVFLLARRLYDVRIGALSAIVYATLPGVSVSAGIISTDVPLLMCWALALYALVALRDTWLAGSRAWWPALLLGLALGLGLNAKYAMAWFAVCLAVYLIATPAERGLMRGPRLWIAFAIAALLIAPNIGWNLAHKFATFSHTADNAKWHGSLVNPLKALEFLAAQFGVFGPVLFGALLVITWRAWREGLPEPDRLLLAFALPVVVIITMQALISRAHANWAAVSYVAASVLVTATMVRALDWRWLNGSLALHVALIAALVAATAFAGRFALPTGIDPFARTLGWRDIADAARAEIEQARQRGAPFGAVVADERSVTAELIYYMRNDTTPIKAWREGERPSDHFELTRPFAGSAGKPVLLVSLTDAPEHILSRFASTRRLSVIDLKTSSGKARRATFFALEGYGEKKE